MTFCSVQIIEFYVFHVFFIYIFYWTPCKSYLALDNVLDLDWRLELELLWLRLVWDRLGGFRQLRLDILEAGGFSLGSEWSLFFLVLEIIEVVEVIEDCLDNWGNLEKAADSKAAAVDEYDIFAEVSTYDTALICLAILITCL